MINQITIRNFKQFDDVVVELGQNVVLIGPNNSGKTTVLQALALWQIGLTTWRERRGNVSSKAEQRTGVVINRQDLLPIPLPSADLLWRDLRTRKGTRTNGQTRTQPVRIEIVVDGVDAQGQRWSCGLEFDYSNSEALYVRPLRVNGDGDDPVRMDVPAAAHGVRVAYLPPMSGLAAEEPLLQAGRINVLIGQGRTSEVLRNLCWMVHEQSQEDWQQLVDTVERMFKLLLQPPIYNQARGEIDMTYQRDGHDVALALASTGQGMRHTILILAYMLLNPDTVLLLDEPDAHLEILRQRQIYNLITEVARERGCQIVAASHSRVLMEEAAKRDVAVAFLGKPHRIDNNNMSQVAKALDSIDAADYYLAEQTGWVLYLEGPTDLAILRALAQRLGHPAAKLLERPFVHYVHTNTPQRVRDHFFGLRDAKPDLVCYALFDRLDKALEEDTPITWVVWRRREIENYITTRATLLSYANSPAWGGTRHTAQLNLPNPNVSMMTDVLDKFEEDFPNFNQGMTVWSPDIKASESVLPNILRIYHHRLGVANPFNKSDYHVLARYVPLDEIDPEVAEKLDVIADVASRARPRT